MCSQKSASQPLPPTDHMVLRSPTPPLTNKPTAHSLGGGQSLLTSE